MMLSQDIATSRSHELRKAEIARSGILPNPDVMAEITWGNLEPKRKEAPSTQQVSRGKLHACAPRLVLGQWVCR
jgi:hypothetical protein